MTATGQLGREDIQHISDLRLIAMALKKRWEMERGSLPGCYTRLDCIIAECEALIRFGPEEFRFVLEPTASAGLIDVELRTSVFGRGRGRRVEL